MIEMGQWQYTAGKETMCTNILTDLNAHEIFLLQSSTRRNSLYLYLKTSLVFVMYSSAEKCLTVS